MLQIQRIVSGGQTGVDRGALDAAMECGVAVGGWCPMDRSAEDGEIPAKYPLKPADKPGNRERTLRNVMDSDGTLIICHGTLSGGTQETLQFCLELRRPYLLVDAREIPTERAAQFATEFIVREKIRVLNVAGPRASEWAEGYAYAKVVINQLSQLR
jgi:hypothetical protein